VTKDQANRGTFVRNWIGQTKSRSLEMGTVILISPVESTESEAAPSTNDQLFIHVSGEKFPASCLQAGPMRMAINLNKGPTLILEPVPAGHPAHGERSAPGIPTSVWKVISVG
jgi:hypothetical protein